MSVWKSSSIKLVSLNIEKSKHLDRVLPFLARRLPDVFCVQELFERDIRLFSDMLGGDSAYVPMTRRVNETPPEPQGIGIFSRLPILGKQVRYYQRTPGRIPDSDTRDRSTFRDNDYVVLAADVEKDGTPFRIATTHFTWTPDGKPDDLQRAHVGKLLAILERLGEFVACGDFNAPRVGEIFGMLAARYKDNIPARYATSIDVSLHRAGRTKPRELEDKMVDGLFSTPGYAVSDVELACGVSDHCAIVASVAKARP